MESVTLVTLTGFADIFEQFQNFADLYELEVPRVVVTSLGVRPTLHHPERWTVIEGIEPFVFSRNANLGLKATQGDVLLVNDDVQFRMKNSIARLREAAYWNPKVGIVSPQILGGVGNVLQNRRFDLQTNVAISDERLAFVCVYIKRSVIDAIGFLDERFVGYGGDDDDYCLRTQRAGFELAVTPEVVVRHGFGAAQSSSSFERTMGQTRNSMLEMRRLLEEKNRNELTTISNQ